MDGMRSFVGYYCLLEAAARCWLSFTGAGALYVCTCTCVQSIFLYNCVAEAHCGIPRAVRPPSTLKQTHLIEIDHTRYSETPTDSFVLCCLPHFFLIFTLLQVLFLFHFLLFLPLVLRSWNYYNFFHFHRHIPHHFFDWTIYLSKFAYFCPFFAVSSTYADFRRSRSY